jgi:hypothetical protein
MKQPRYDRMAEMLRLGDKNDLCYEPKIWLCHHLAFDRKLMDVSERFEYFLFPVTDANHVGSYLRHEIYE